MRLIFRSTLLQKLCSQLTAFFHFSGGGPLHIRFKCNTAAVAIMALVLPSRKTTGKPVLTLLKMIVLPSQNCLKEGPAQKTAVLTVASHLVSSGSG